MIMDLNDLVNKVKEETGNPELVDALVKQLQTTNNGTRQMMTPEQRIDYINSMTRIEDVRVALRTAQAKRSKPHKDPERYEQEIKTARERLNALIALANAHTGGRLAGFKEYGDSINKLVQVFLEEKEGQISGLLKALEAKGLTKQGIKKGASDYPATVIPGTLENTILKDLGPEGLKIWVKRTGKAGENGDLRVRSLNQKVQLLEAGMAPAPKVEVPVEEPKVAAEGEAPELKDEAKAEVKSAIENKGLVVPENVKTGKPERLHQVSI